LEQNNIRYVTGHESLKSKVITSTSRVLFNQSIYFYRTKDAKGTMNTRSRSFLYCTKRFLFIHIWHFHLQSFKGILMFDFDKNLLLHTSYCSSNYELFIRDNVHVSFVHIDDILQRSLRAPFRLRRIWTSRNNLSSCI